LVGAHVLNVPEVQLHLQSVIDLLLAAFPTSQWVIGQGMADGSGEFQVLCMGEAGFLAGDGSDFHLEI
jgi:hypothetical protein